MICYLDSSVVLRHVLGERGSYEPWGRWTECYASALLPIEALRVIDRLRLSRVLSDLETVRYIDRLHQVLDYVGEIALNDIILKRASQPFSVTVGTLDAIHCATAELLQMHINHKIVVLTHDKQLGIAAQSLGLVTKGY